MGKPILERLALHRPELRAWAMYDWANSAFITVIVTTIWPIFYTGTVNADKTDGLARHAFFSAGALGIVAVLAPLLGVLADRAPIKKKFLGAFLFLGLLSTFGLAFVNQGQWVLGGTLFALASIGASASFVFYDSLLPHIATSEEMDRVSVAGYAIGYLGGGLLLAALLAINLKPELVGLSKIAAVKVSFVSVAVWWFLFSIPLFKTVSEPVVPAEEAKSEKGLIFEAFSGIRDTLSELRRFPNAFLFLIAFLVYNDGIGTIIRMAASFGDDKGIASADLISAILVVQFVGIPFTFAFGAIAGKIGTKSAIFAGLFVYCGVSVIGYFIDGFTIFGYEFTTRTLFFALSGLVGVVQGGVQALSRSLFASMIPKEKSSAFFGLFAVFERFAGIFGPLIFGIIVTHSSSENAIFAVIGFFVVGGAILAKVDVKAGQDAVKR